MNSGKEKPSSPDFIEKDLYRIIVFSTCLGFGALAAFLYSIRDMEKDVTLVFSTGTVVAFAAGALSGWVFWRIVKLLVARHSRRTED